MTYLWHWSMIITHFLITLLKGFCLTESGIYLFTCSFDPHLFSRITWKLQMALCDLVTWNIKSKWTNQPDLMGILNYFISWLCMNLYAVNRSKTYDYQKIAILKPHPWLCIHTTSDTQRQSQAMSFISMESQRHERQ